VVTFIDRVARLLFTFKEPSSPGWITALATAILPGKEGFYADADAAESGAGRIFEANRERPGLREALAACREGDTLVVTKLDRLARSLPDARAIADELTVRQVSLNLGGSVYDPTDPVGRLLFNVLAMVAEFEPDLIRLRTREGMKVAKAKGHLRGKQPKLNHRQEAHLVALLDTGEYTTAELADLFSVGRSTVYRAVERERALKESTPPTEE
jgi:DNA invertase Pin-like site-specific DNA recombinase